MELIPPMSFFFFLFLGGDPGDAAEGD